MKLSELNLGQKAKIIKLDNKNKEKRRHLLDMGVTRNTVVTVKKKAPSGDPVTIFLRDYELCLSKDILNGIEVEVIRK